MLHLISAAPIETAVLARIDVGSSIVFMDSAVLGILRAGRLSERLAKLTAEHRVYALSSDLLMRGIDPGQLVEGIEVIDFSDLVELTVAHPLIQSWH